MRATAAGDNAKVPAELPIELVMRDSQNTHVNISLVFPETTKPETDTVPPKRVGRYTIVVTGCLDPNAPAATGDNPPAKLVFGAVTREITTARNGWVWAGAALAILAVGIGIAVWWNAGAAGGAWKSFLYVFSNYRSTVSLSSFQLFVFFSAVFITVAYCFGRRWQLTDLSTGVLYLLGISASGAVAGAWGDAAKDRLSWDNWRWLDQRGAFPKALKDVDLNLGQLVTTRGEFDMYRFQALLFTLLVAPTFVITSVYTLGEASVPTGILAVLGLSQVTYLAGKMSGVPTIADFDAQLSALRKDSRGREGAGRGAVPQAARRFRGGDGPRLGRHGAGLEPRRHRERPRCGGRGGDLCRAGRRPGHGGGGGGAAGALERIRHP